MRDDRLASLFFGGGLGGICSMRAESWNEAGRGANYKTPGTPQRSVNANIPTSVPPARRGPSLRRPTKKKHDLDLPLREDIRYLGRILGDTIREQAGPKVFDLVERIRLSAFSY